MTSSISLILLIASLAIALVMLAVTLALTLKKQHRHQLIHKDASQLLELELSSLSLNYEQIQNEHAKLKHTLITVENDYDGVKEELHQSSIELEVLKAKQLSEKAAAVEKLQLLESSKHIMKVEFENLANQLLESKSQTLQKKQEGFFSQTMQPLKEQLVEFRQRIDKVYDADSRDRLSLLKELEQLKSLNLKMSDDAINLTNALKGNQKFQGNWGELVLERVLETSGLRAGYEFELQAHKTSEQGKRQYPDVIVNLPEDKHIIIDSKVSLIDYQRCCEAQSDEDRTQYSAKHVLSVRNHIKDLSGKKYDCLVGVNSLDFVFLFMPIEAAFILALDASPDLFQYAYDKHVILVSPSTLLATLRTIENLWRYERQNLNAEEIAKQAGGLYDQCVLVAESIEDIGQAIHKTQDAYELAAKRLSSGRGNVIKRIESIKQLGAKTKRQLSDNLVAESQANLETLSVQNTHPILSTEPDE